MTGDLISIVLADDHVLVRSGLKSLLATTRDMRVVGEASDGAEAVAAVERLRPDVVVMDLEMPGMDGLAATQAIARKGLPTRVLILTMHDEETELMPVLEAGAAGYLVKSVAERELTDAIRAVAYGDVYVRPHAARTLARGVQRKDPHREDRQRFEALTEREQAVLRLVAHGYSGPEIGGRLKISAKTVDTYKQRIEEKVGLSHRTDYIQFALRLGMLEPDSPAR